MAMGVKAVELDEDDHVVEMELVEEDADLLVISENGFGKRTSLAEFKKQKRGGKGLICYRVNQKTGKIVGAKVVKDDDEVMLINTHGVIIRLKTSEISRMGRNTQGVTLMKVDEDANICSVAKVVQESESEE